VAYFLYWCDGRGEQSWVLIEKIRCLNTTAKRNHDYEREAQTVGCQGTINMDVAVVAKVREVSSTTQLS
jgi:hypothetical protein